MSDDTMGTVLTGGYGLVLGLALGAALWSGAPTWREAAVSACWMGAIEVGPSPDASCVPGTRLARVDQAVRSVRLAEALPLR